LVQGYSDLFRFSSVSSTLFHLFLIPFSVLPGAGGSGKTKSINALLALAAIYGQPKSVVVGAYTGIAASILKGATLDALRLIGARKPDGAALLKLRAKWSRVKMLVIDEVLAVRLSVSLLFLCLSVRLLTY
jgi:hypothetical protein